MVTKCQDSHLWTHCDAIHVLRQVGGQLLQGLGDCSQRRKAFSLETAEAVESVEFFKEGRGRSGCFGGRGELGVPF